MLRKASEYFGCFPKVFANIEIFIFLLCATFALEVSQLFLVNIRLPNGECNTPAILKARSKETKKLANQKRFFDNS